MIVPTPTPLPEGACDTHMHFYDARYPAATTTVLEPPDATATAYRQVQLRLGLERVVVVQPTTYGLDNSCQLDAMAALDCPARAVVAVDHTVSERELYRLTRAGARGARFHMLPGGALDWESLPKVAGRIAEHGWHIQLQLDGHQLGRHLDMLQALPTPLVIDHVGRFMPPVPIDHPDIDALRGLVDDGDTWIKLSAPYESARDPTHEYAFVGDLASALVAQAPERMLWATNWPHPGQNHPPPIERLAELLAEWIPDAATRTMILVDNPASFYDFDD